MDDPFDELKQADVNPAYRKVSAGLVDIKSYALRASRMSDLQKNALTQLYPKYGLEWNPGSPVTGSSLFGSSAPFLVEIGFGMGAATATIAENRPDAVFLGIEVHAPGVGKLLSEIEQRHISNLKVCRHDAVEVIESMLAIGSVDGFHAFFPDPWPKKKHHKRRIMRPSFVQLLASRLRPGGYLYFVTDWEEYAAATLDVLKAEPLLVNANVLWAEREAWRPLTKFERRAMDAGRVIRELKFLRTEPDPVQTYR
jgi:tRNA (guanine-N7-)-methyltransferase